MKAGKLQSLIMSVFGCFYAFVAYSATSLFSDYGQIQNVQNYSTNPFWSPTTPYNQKLPQPVYVQGVNITTEECIQVVQSAVAFQCAARNNCINTALSDIRPSIIVQLSNLPGKAYSTACAGYLDTVFESYVAQYGNYAPKQRVGLPQATVPNPAINNNNAIQIQNPYEVKPSREEQEIIDRTQELENLQRQNGSGVYELHATDSLPGTIADVSLKERLSNAAEGYEPYAGKSAYKTITTQNEFSKKTYCETHNDPAACQNYKDPKQQKVQQNIQNTSAAQNTSATQNNKTSTPNSSTGAQGGSASTNNSQNTNTKVNTTYVRKVVDGQTQPKTNDKNNPGGSTSEIKYGGFICETALFDNVIDIASGFFNAASTKQEQLNSCNPDTSKADNGCFMICGGNKQAATDNLNTKVFRPILKEIYCVNPSTGALQSVTTEKLLQISKKQMEQVVTTIKSNVMDKGDCNYSANRRLFWYGYYDDPDAEEPTFISQGSINLDGE